jgi:hypothetical protein
MSEAQAWAVREQIEVGIAECEIAETAHQNCDYAAAAEAQHRAEHAYRGAQAEIRGVTVPIELRRELDRLRLALIKLSRLKPG